MVNFILPNIFPKSVIVGYFGLTCYMVFILVKLLIGKDFSGKELSCFFLVGHPYSVLQMCPLINLAGFSLKECRLLTCLEDCFRNFMP